MTWTSIREAADRLDVTEDTINTLAGQMADDPDLYDPERGISPTGMELLAEQVASTDPIFDSLIEQIRQTTDRRAAAKEALDVAEQAWQAAIRAAVSHGVARNAIAREAQISRERVYQIRDGRR